MGANCLRKKTNLVLLILIITIYLSTFSTALPDTPGNVNLANAYPQNQNANYNPQLSISLTHPQGKTMTVTFETNASGSWQTLGTYTGGNGQYTQDTQNMNVKNRRYYWRISIYDGSVWTVKTYSFVAQAFVLKWSYNIGTTAHIGPLAVDVNKDGIYEVFATSDDHLICFDGLTGRKIWDYTNVAIGDHSPFEIGDLNNDGTPEVVIAAGARTIALHADDGSIYWNKLVESGNLHLLILDTEGNNYPYVYIASSDVDHGADGTGRIRKLRGTDGTVLAEAFSWRPCYGGLSAADANNDGKFEIYMGDRSVYYHPPSLGKGMQAYNADNLSLLWYDDEILCSSHIPALIDVNNDNILDAVAVEQSSGGIWVINGATGKRMAGKWGNNLGLSGHSQFSIWDLDKDNRLELITAADSNTTSWDLGLWKADGKLVYTGEPPKMADVIGDADLEVVMADGSGVKIYDRNYNLLERFGSNSLASSIAQDIDGDGQNELILISTTGNVQVYETSAYAPTPRVRTNNQYYSERRLGAGVYVPLPGAPQPFIKNEYPKTGSDGVVENPKLSFYAVDYRHDLLDITVSTNASGSWKTIQELHNVGNGVYNFTTTGMTGSDKTYYWRVSVVDTHNDNIPVTKTFQFTTKQTTGNNTQNDTSSYRKRIDINHLNVAGNIAGFPVLIDIDDSSLASKARSDGADIYFTASDGNTPLTFEIEKYSAGHLVAWVRTDLSSAQDTSIYMYYGDSTSGSAQNPSGVWDANYLTVHHMDETSGTLQDSTSKNNDGTPLNGVNENAIGKIDGSDQFDGVDDRIQLPRIFSSQTQFTFEAWLNPGVKHGYAISQWDTTYQGAFIQFNPNSFQLYVNGQYIIKPTTANSWHYVVGTYDGSTARLYVDGGSPATMNAALTWPNLNMMIGDRSALNRAFLGNIDEVRISDIPRSEAYIRTAYNNMNNPANFITLNPEESVASMALFNVALSSVELLDSEAISEALVNESIVESAVNASCIDADNDLYNLTGDLCGPIDCQDADASINPGAAEVCSDGIDNNCDGGIDENCGISLNLTLNTSLDFPSNTSINTTPNTSIISNLSNITSNETTNETSNETTNNITANNTLI